MKENVLFFLTIARRKVRNTIPGSSLPVSKVRSLYTCACARVHTTGEGVPRFSYSEDWFLEVVGLPPLHLHKTSPASSGEAYTTHTGS